MKLTKNQMLNIISNYLEVENISMDSTILNTDEWDSLSQLAILTDLDNALDGKVTDIEGIANAESVNEIFNLLNENSLIELNFV